ncbi:SDR family oxidoreductase [Ilumatobacter sp.]|uniref:SDR family oxidoreductase n=1 Tax=Ilumatobacter sp. TaxID=1967498 RepID=UPI003C3EFA63
MTRSLVTGASTGIGFATALRLATEGHEVHASVRSLESGQALLDASTDLDLALVVMDVDDDDSVSVALDRLQAEHGPIDVLINNAGIAAGHSIEETSVSEFQRVMNTNTWGTLRCIHAVLPSMRDRSAGHIVNVTSLAGRVAIAGHGAYATSKFAAEALTEVLAAETKPFGIRVTLIEPGVIMTPIFAKGMQDPENPDTPYIGGRRLGEFFASALMGSPGTPDMVAEVIWRAITADAPELRHVVGDDAVCLVGRRLDLTDEEWIAGQSDPDDDRHRAWISDMTGVQVNALPG